MGSFLCLLRHLASSLPSHLPEFLVHGSTISLCLAFGFFVAFLNIFYQKSPLFFGDVWCRYVAPPSGRAGLDGFLSSDLMQHGFALLSAQLAPTEYGRNPLESGDETQAFLHFSELAAPYMLYVFQKTGSSNSSDSNSSSHLNSSNNSSGSIESSSNSSSNSSATSSSDSTAKLDAAS